MSLSAQTLFTTETLLHPMANSLFLPPGSVLKRTTSCLMMFLMTLNSGYGGEFSTMRKIYENKGDVSIDL